MLKVLIRKILSSICHELFGALLDFRRLQTDVQLVNIMFLELLRGLIGEYALIHVLVSGRIIHKHVDHVVLVCLREICVLYLVPRVVHQLHH